MSLKNFVIGVIIGGVIGYLIAKMLVKPAKEERIREEYKPTEYIEYRGHVCRWC